MNIDTKNKIEDKIDLIIKYYNESIESLFDISDGGTIRGKKGHLVEKIAKDLINITWTDILKQDMSRLSTKPEKIDIKVKDYTDYYNKIKGTYTDLKKEDLKDFVYKFSTDLHVKIEDDFVLSIECKSYTEISMFRRIIFDAVLINNNYPKVKHCLLQLENNFSKSNYHIIQSYFDKRIDVITLLDGNRNAKKPIHKREYKKELKKEKLYDAIECFESILKEYSK